VGAEKRAEKGLEGSGGPGKQVQSGTAGAWIARRTHTARAAYTSMDTSVESRSVTRWDGPLGRNARQRTAPGARTVAYKVGQTRVRSVDAGHVPSVYDMLDHTVATGKVFTSSKRQVVIEKRVENVPPV